MEFLKRLFPGLAPAPNYEEATDNPSPPPAPQTPRMTPDQIRAENRYIFGASEDDEDDEQPDIYDEALRFDWVNSESGNPTCENAFLNATVFQRDGGWKFVLNVTGGSRSDAVFSQRFRSEDEAIVMAEQKMEEMVQEVLARRR